VTLEKSDGLGFNNGNEKHELNLQNVCNRYAILSKTIGFSDENRFMRCRKTPRMFRDFTIEMSLRHISGAVVEKALCLMKGVREWSQEPLVFC
jgi:hypothetical protein